MGRTVIFKIYRTVEDANLAHDFLLEHQIPSTVQVDQIDGGVRLLLDENDLEKAQEILKQ